MKPFDRYFPVVLFIMLYKVVLTYDSVDKKNVDEIRKGDHSVESCWRFFPAFYVVQVVQGGSNAWVSGWNALYYCQGRLVVLLAINKRKWSEPCDPICARNCTKYIMVTSLSDPNPHAISGMSRRNKIVNLANFQTRGSKKGFLNPASRH